MAESKATALNRLLRAATISGVENSVRIHIERGDDLNARDHTGQTPLMLSAARNKAAICGLLLAAGADADLLDLTGRSALRIAQDAGAREAVETILAAGVSEKLPFEEERSGSASADSAPSACIVNIDLPAPLSYQCPLQPVFLTGGDTADIPDISSSHDVAELGIDLTGWEAEEDKAPPDDDSSLAAVAFGAQNAIALHEPIDTSVVWDEVEVFLPDKAREQPQTNNAEARDRLRLLLLRAIREGSVPKAAIEDLACGEGDAPDEETFASLLMIVNDLGAEADERIEYSAPHESFLVHIEPEEAPEEDEAVTEALAFVDDRAARRSEPLRIYQREFQKIELLTAEGEIALAQAMERSIDVALDALASWPVGIRAVLDAAAAVACGAKPLRSISSLGGRLETQGAESALSTDSDVESEMETDGSDIEADEDRQFENFDGESVSDFERFNTMVALLGKLALADCSTLNDVGWRERREVLVQLKLTRGYLDDLPSSVPDSTSEPACSFVQGMSTYRAARNRMAVANLKLVFSIGRNYIFSGEPLDDLLQEGNMGLLKAVDRYDWRKGFKFSTYATWWIRQQIGRHIPDRGRSIRLPVHVYEKTQRISMAARAYELRHGVAPTTEVIAQLVGMSVSKVSSLIRSTIEPLSLHRVRALDELITADALDRFTVSDPCNAVEEIQLTEAMRSCLAILKPMEQGVIRMRFGLGAGQTMTLEEIGVHFGVTRERIRQIEAKALSRLKRSVSRDWLVNDVSGGLQGQGCRRAILESDTCRDDMYPYETPDFALERTIDFAR